MELGSPGISIARAFRRNVALVCGVDRYAPGIPQLRTAVADARAIAGALATHGFEPTVLLDEQVTRERIRGFLAEREIDLTYDDRLLVYFAGHGLSAPSKHGPEGFLLFSDAASGDPSSYFAMATLRQLLDPLICRHMLLLLDCCFAGTFQWASRRDLEPQPAPIYQQTLKRYVSRRAWQVLVSACHDEPASDVAGVGDELVLRTPRTELGQHSPFATALLAGLSGHADYTNDGLIIATELELYARSYVEKVTETRQTPQLYKLDRHDRGEFVFQVPGRPISLQPAPALRAENCPYPGARAFTPEEHELFFGRREATRHVIERVKTQPFTAVLGPSGSGKSSLLQAGLIPWLRSDSTTSVVIACPGPDPITSICNEISLVNGPVICPASLLDHIDAWMASSVGDRLVIIVDQAEQLVTLSSEDVLETFLRELGHAIEQHSTRLRVVFGVRSEYEPVLARSILRDQWTFGRYEVPPPTQDELREMIERPARHHELSFEPQGLIDTLINAVHMTPGALATLSSSLGELYKRVVDRDEDRLISTADYEAMGGVSGVLAQRASATLRSLTKADPAHELTARRILLRMTTRRNGVWVRRCADPVELVCGDVAEQARGQTLLRAFERNGLMVRGHDGWELAHDALARTWPALFTSSDAPPVVPPGVPALLVRLLPEIAQATRVWATHGKQTANLWRNTVRLDRLRWLRRACKGYFSALEHEFMRRSIARRRFRAIRKLTLVFAALVLTAGAIAGWDRYFRRFDDDYAGYVRRWGAPMGVHPLSAKEASLRAQAVRLSRRGRSGRVKSAEIIRYGARCAPEPPSAGYQPPVEVMSLDAREGRSPCHWEFRYDPGADTVRSEVVTDVDGRSLYTLVYRPTKDPRTVLAEYLDAEGRSIRSSRGDAELVELHRNGQGLDVEIRHMRNDGPPALSEKAIHAEQISYDSELNVTGTRYLDRFGNPAYDTNGVAGWRATYGDRGNKLDQTYIDTSGDATHDKHGISRHVLSYDPAGNQIAQRWFDEQGNPVRDRNGIAGWRMTYDPQAQATERTNLDETGAPTADITGVVRRRTSYDHGNAIRIRNLDRTNRPVWDRSGAAGWNMIYDSHHHLIELTVVDELGRPTRNRHGIAGWRRSYDERGDTTKEVYLDERGTPSPTKAGVASIVMSYDPRGNMTRVDHQDTLGKPARDRDGIASIVMSYDARGNIIDITYIGEDGGPVRNASGIIHIHNTYDSMGNLIEEGYQDENGYPAPNDAGVATVRMSCDDRGNELSIAYFDKDNRPTRDPSGIEVLQITYDRFGNPTRTSYRDSQGRLVRSKDGIAGLQVKLDKAGHEIAIMYLDEYERPTRSKDGYAGKFISYDAHGNKVEVVFLDEGNNPTHDRDGVSRWRGVFDARGNLTESRYSDEEDRPIHDKTGVAIERATYDARSNQVRREYFDAANRAVQNSAHVAGWRASYDVFGNMTERAFIDEVGAATADVDGVAIVRSAYDAFGNEITRTTLDVTGKPVRVNAGIATTRTSDDRRDPAVAFGYLEEASQPLAPHSRAHAARTRKSPDHRSDNVAPGHLDDIEKATPVARRVAGLRMTYDTRGRETSRQYLDEAGKPSRNADGVAGMQFAYDDYDNITEVAYLDEAGAPVRSKDGIAILRLSYNSYGNVTQASYFDPAGKRVRGKDGTAGWNAAYDRYGRVFRWTNVDPRGDPVRAIDGVCRWQVDYDRYGNPIERVYLDERKQILNRRDGVAIIRWTYDPDGRLARTIWMDADQRVLFARRTPPP